MSNKTEVFVGVAGYEGRYEVSNMGNVRSLRTGLLLKSVLSSGYPKVALCGDAGSITSTRIHRLVAAAFVEPAEGATMVNHKNGIKTDNRADNLEWCTARENLLHAQMAGLRPKSTSWMEAFGGDHPNAKAVYEKNDSGELVNSYDSTATAGRTLGIRPEVIAGLARRNGKNRKTKTRFSYTA